MTPFFIKNTLTRRREEFVPLTPGNVGLYTCGPTVYNLATIGNFRAYIFEDLLHRLLEFKGYAVNRVMNITDVDDKTIAGARREGKPLREYTDRYIAEFLKDMETLRIKKPGLLPRATDHIPEMVVLIEKLLATGHAYRKDGAIYFKIASFPAYGGLSHLDMATIKPGARVDADEYTKEDVRDFALWKEEREDEDSWETPLGRGRPGWHIECSAMSMKYLGESFDIHTGGVDNIFPHHENEIAQSEAATGKPFVRYWMHCAHLLVDGEKMAKSKGNFYTLRDLIEKGYDPAAVRYLLLTTHYRDPLNFTETSLQQAGNTVRNYNDFYRRIEAAKPVASDRPADTPFSATTRKAIETFEKELSDDLNISAAMGAVFDFIREANILASRGLPAGAREEILGFLGKIENVLQILDRGEETIAEEDLALIRERDEARKTKNFKRSDEIRDLLKAKGILLEDTPQGAHWKKTA